MSIKQDAELKRLTERVEALEKLYAGLAKEVATKNVKVKR